MPRCDYRVVFGFLLLLVTNNIVTAADMPAIRDHLRERIARLEETTAVTRRFILAVYEDRDYQPIWSSPTQAERLLEYLAGVDRDGLLPEDYQLARLRALWQRSSPDPETAAARDLLATDALLRLISHLRFGKVDPKAIERGWNLDHGRPGEDLATLFEQAVRAESLAAFLETLAPRRPIYARLRAALAHYRTIEAAGGWPMLVAGSTLREGMRDERVAALRARLAISDESNPASAEEPGLFDAGLDAAVRHFQRRHGLAVDGAVGQRTLAALNVPIDDRIDQIRVNLERARWVLHNLGDDYLAVNIAAFEAYLLRDGELIWSSRVVVGRPYRRTPVFRATLQYLVFNPTWTVPPTILRNDVLPKLRHDPAYLAQQNFDVLDHAGHRIDPEGIDWSGVTARTFPYLLRQRPGPDNALGRVKFMFPNEYDVYLHDTPSRQLFQRPERTFSSGCIRVEQARELAEHLLDDPAQWDRAAIDAVIAGTTSRTVVLPRPIEVLLLYWTAMVDSEGIVFHYADVYSRDAELLAALNQPSTPAIASDEP